MKAAFLVVLALAAGCATRTEHPPVTVRHLSERGTLPFEVRTRLTSRMDLHGRTMNDLVWAVILLDREGTASLATEIAAGSPIAAELGHGVPPRFAALERSLLEQTAALARKARSATVTDAALGRAFGRLSSTCVDCHATYLYGDDEPDVPNW